MALNPTLMRFDEAIREQMQASVASLREFLYDLEAVISDNIQEFDDEDSYSDMLMDACNDLGEQCG